MTSNTTPYGEAVGTQITNEENYRAFDNNDGTYAGTNTYNGWTGYKFVNPTCVKFVKFRPYLGRVKNYSIDVSSDGNTWTPIKSNLVCSNVSTNQAVDLENDNDYLMYRLNNSSTWDGNGYTVYSLQFYGFDYSEKEFEQGATKKWLYDHGVEVETIGTGGTVTVEKRDSDIKINDNTTSAYGIVSTPNINLANYNVVRAKFGNEMVVSSSSFIRVGNTIASTAIQANQLPNNNGLDISAVTDTDRAYIAPANTGGTGVLTLTEWWLE